MWVQSLPIPSMAKDQSNQRVRVKTLTIFHITELIWWAVMLVQFLWNCLKQFSNVGHAEVHITNISAQITLALVLLLVHTRRRRKKKNFKRINCSFVSPIWAIEAGSGRHWALIG